MAVEWRTEKKLNGSLPPVNRFPKEVSIIKEREGLQARDEIRLALA